MGLEKNDVLRSVALKEERKKKRKKKKEKKKHPKKPTFSATPSSRSNPRLLSS